MDSYNLINSKAISSVLKNEIGMDLFLEGYKYIMAE